MKPALTLALSLTAACLQAQILPPAGLTSGPGVIAALDTREPEVLKTCKVPPPPPRGRGGAGRGPAPAAGPRDYMVTEIAGVIAEGQQWKEIWQVGGNVDGLVAAKDGDILIAENDKSDVVKLDRGGKPSVVYSGTNTGGSLAMNSKGVLFVANRGLNPSIEQLAPRRKTLANRNGNGDPFDCIGGLLNDITADRRGGVYFTMGGVFYADAKGVVTRYGENVFPNGIALSADEKRLFVTNGPALAAFDVQKDGSLINQREFAKWEGGGNGDGCAFDGMGRLYVTTNQGVQVIGPDGKYLGLIPTPRGVVSIAFGGTDRKTLYVVARDNPQNNNWILAIPMLAQGAKARSK